MTHLEVELQQLKQEVVDMMQLVKQQLQKSEQAIIDMDTATAQEIIHHETRVNAYELSIDRNCENIFALFNPVAVDLRFVLAALKINNQLERIGDHAEAIAKYVLELEKPFDDTLIKQIKFHKMYETSLSMIDDFIEAYENEDTTLAREVFQKDSALNKINNSAGKVIAEFAQKNPEKIQEILFLFSTIRKLERVGDLAKNVAEETIFFIEAKVLKHEKKKKKLS